MSVCFYKKRVYKYCLMILLQTPFQGVVGKLKSKVPSVEAAALKKTTETKDSEVETTEILDRME